MPYIFLTSVRIATLDQKSFCVIPTVLSEMQGCQFYAGQNKHSSTLVITFELTKTYAEGPSPYAYNSYSYADYNIPPVFHQATSVFHQVTSVFHQVTAVFHQVTAVFHESFTHSSFKENSFEVVLFGPIGSVKESRNFEDIFNQRLKYLFLTQLLN